MINRDSIVTAYDEHLTLVEWLQKVSKALNESVLTNLGIAKLSDQGNVATYRVTATFADNTTIVSDTFTLPSTNIVTAFNNLTALVNGFDDRITDNTNDVASILNIIDIANDKIKASTLQNSINGSDEVIVDIGATNDKLEIHLSAELQAKLARVLLKPSSAPSTRKVVTIDTNGAQDNVDGTELTTLMDNIVDSHGNKRFICGNFPVENINGITWTYHKWSLSGTHLMIVLEGKNGSDTNITFEGNEILGNLQDSRISYIYDKIPILTAYDLVSTAMFRTYLNFTTTEKGNLSLTKPNANHLRIINWNNAIHDIPAGSAFRVQFDLLIDNE